MRYNLDDEARIEMLGFLVFCQLYSRAAQGKWLSDIRRSTQARLWLSLNGGHCGIDEERRIARWSRDCAQRLSDLPWFLDKTQLEHCITPQCRLDYRHPTVRRLHDACAAYLQERTST